MSKSNHTPGPWRFQKEVEYTFHPESPQRQILYQIYKDGGIYGNPATCKSEEDARLIAAAPDLLEALEDYLAAGYMEARRAASVKAKAAIAKAKGVES